MEPQKIKYDDIQPDPTQYQLIKSHLVQQGKITTWDAIKKYKVTRLSEYIRILRSEGMEIDMVWGHRNKKRFAIYSVKRDMNVALDQVREIQKEAESNPPVKRGTRQLHLGDYMTFDSGRYKAIITSLPDLEETGHETIEEWKEWFESVCEKLSKELDDKGVIFFYQTDRKHKGTLIDKKNIITNVMIRNGFHKILSKIVLKQEPETISLFRPSFTDLFAFSKKLKGGKVTPDVFPAGDSAYRNAMGNIAIDVCLNYIEKNIDSNLIFNPFCGSGSILKRANDRGFDTFGIDIDPDKITNSKKI